jgi:methyl-accepting chemotaxis protein
MRRESDQVAKSMVEQARAVKDISGSAKDISKQVGLIARSNRDHTVAATSIAASIKDVRRITEQNARAVEETLRSTDSLIQRAQTFNSIVEGLAENGFVDRKGKNKKKQKK